MLPFVVEPTKTFPKVRVGTAETGILEIEKYEELSVLERKFIAEQELFDYARTLAKLAHRVSKEAGENFVYANDRINAYIFQNLIEGDTVTYKKKTATVVNVEERLLSVKVNETTIEDKPITEVTIDIDGKTQTVKLENLTLVDPDWYGAYYSDIVELQSNLIASFEPKNIAYATAVLKYRVMADWSIEQSENPKLKDLITEIAKFAYKEQNGWEETEATPVQHTEESLGNS